MSCCLGKVIGHEKKVHDCSGNGKTNSPVPVLLSHVTKSIDLRVHVVSPSRPVQNRNRLSSLPCHPGTRLLDFNYSPEGREHFLFISPPPPPHLFWGEGGGGGVEEGKSRLQSDLAIPDLWIVPGLSAVCTQYLPISEVLAIGTRYLSIVTADFLWVNRS